MNRAATTMVTAAAPASGWRIRRYPVTHRMIAFSRYTKNPPQVQVWKAPTSHTTPLIARIQPRARIEKVVAVCDLAIQAAPRTISTMPDTRNQPQDFRTSSMPASNTLARVVIVLLLFEVASAYTNSVQEYFGSALLDRKGRSPLLVRVELSKDRGICAEMLFQSIPRGSGRWGDRIRAAESDWCWRFENPGKAILIPMG